MVKKIFSKKLIKNIEAKSKVTLVILLVVFGMVFSMSVLMPETVRADLPLEFSSAYQSTPTSGGTSDDQAEQHSYKNGTNDYWFAYTDYDSTDGYYKHNTTADANNPPVWNTSQGDSFSASIIRIYGFIKNGNQLYLYLTDGSNAVEYITWNGAGWDSPTEIGFSASSGYVCEWDDGANQFWMIYASVTGENINVRNSSDAENWNSATEIDTNGKQPYIVDYNNTLYAWWIDDTTSNVEYKIYNTSTGWGSTQELIAGSYTYTSAVNHSGEECLVVFYGNSTDSIIHCQTYNGTWSGELTIANTDSTGGSYPQCAKYEDNRVILHYKAKPSGGGYTGYYVYANYSVGESVFSVDGGVGSEETITWSLDAGGDAWSNGSAGWEDGDQLNITTHVNVSDNVTDMYLVMANLTVGGNWISTSDLTCVVSIDDDAGYGTGFSLSDNVNFSFDTNWASLSIDANPFPINDVVWVNMTFYVRFYLDTTQSNAGQYVNSTAWLVKWHEVS